MECLEHKLEHNFAYGKIKPIMGMVHWWDLKLDSQRVSAQQEFAAIQELMRPIQLSFDDILSWDHIAGQLHLDALLMKPNQYCNQRHYLVFARQFNEFIPYTTPETEKYFLNHITKKGKFNLFIGAYPVDDDKCTDSGDDLSAFSTLDAIGMGIYYAFDDVLMRSVAKRIEVEPPTPLCVDRMAQTTKN